MALTREEQYLQSIADGEISEMKPITREEAFLAKASGQDVGDLTPITRKEYFLSKISGGGESDIEAQWIAAIERDGSNPVTKLPDGVTVIGEYAFYKYTNLVLTTLPDGITSIGAYAFQGCTRIGLLALPSSLNNIGMGAFYSCGFATSELEIPAGVLNIGATSFRNNSALNVITFKGKPTTLFANSFLECENITTINVPWAEGEVANAPWGATNATINYNYTGE